MLKKLSPSLLLLAFMICITLVVPTVAHAQSATVPDCSAGGDFYTNYSQDLANRAQEKAAAIHNFYSGIPALDLKANYCIDQIQKLFDLAIGISDPLNIVLQLVASQLTTLLNQVCSAAIQTATSLVNFGLSQFNRLCVPLPNLNLNLGGGLNLTGPPCNGVNILGIKTTTGGNALAPSVWQIWGNGQ